MARQPSASTTSSSLVLQTVTWATKHGFRPIPLTKGSKAAAHKDYQNEDYSCPPEFWHSGDYGVGLLLGPNRNGPVDIDLDCPEAVRLAPYLLPPTDAVFGRKSKLRSHFIYIPDGDGGFPYVAFKDAQGKNILELRGDATTGSSVHQTVFPGSLHADTGEPIEWDRVAFPSPARITYDKLLRACRLLSIGVIIVRDIWNDGFRNAPTLPLVGILAKYGFTRDETMNLFEVLAEHEGKEDKSRIKTINITYNRWEEGKPVAGVPKLRELMGKAGDAVVDCLLELLGSKSVAKMEEYNDKYACVMVNGQRIFRTNVGVTEAPEPMDKGGFLDWNVEDRGEADGKAFKWAQVWLNSPQRRKFPRGLDFLPGLYDTDGTEYEGIFNLWNGWAIPAPTEKPKGSCDAYLELVRDVLCNNDEEFKWVMNFLAAILRDPLKREDNTAVALVLRGEQGAGKSLAMEYFGRILGNYFFTAQSDDHIVGRFTSHLARTLLLHSEEALFSGNPKHAHLLKTLISSPFRTWEAKGIDAKQIRNVLRIVFSSNEARPVPVEFGDRRYTIIDCKDRKVGAALLKKVIAEAKGSGPEALFWYLTQEWDYEPNMLRASLKTKASRDVMLSGLSLVQEWWYEKLRSGVIFSRGFEWCKYDLHAPWDSQVSTAALYFDFLTWKNGTKSDKAGDRDVNANGFSNQLDRLLGDDLQKVQKRYTANVPDLEDKDMDFPALCRRLTDRQMSIINFPTLKECRDRFELLAGDGVKMDWPADEPEQEKPAYVRVQEADAKKAKDKGF
jgi:Family of unknown function (DUF5906)